MLSVEVQLSDDVLAALDALTEKADMPREKIISQVLEEMLPLLKAERIGKLAGFKPDKSEPSTTAK